MIRRALTITREAGSAVSRSEVVPIEVATAELGESVCWAWIDVEIDPASRSPIDTVNMLSMADKLGLDHIAINDALDDTDQPKIDDFGKHLLIVLHGLRDDVVGTYEVDMFLTSDRLVSVRRGPSAALDAVWQQLNDRPELSAGGADELAAYIADALTRRLMAVLDAFDNEVEGLTEAALNAAPTLLEDLTAVRRDLTAVRRVVHPQREALDMMRSTPSRLVSDAGRRRFSDVFDVAARAAEGLDEARTALAETLDAYRGAEARKATDVSKVLTIYAAIMLPLSLVAGIFGMNFTNLPWLNRSWGWMAAAALMVLIALVSFGVFISLGWVRRPSGRRTGQTLGRGLIEASRAPVHLMGAVFEMSAMPLRATSERFGRVIGEDGQDDFPPDN
ncbi:MAG TPA: magnesium transporter CorA family protein [Ilumatobacter sp.]|nr:magnesium transporter CorA family protein [Ilumatobacter sp.]